MKQDDDSDQDIGDDKSKGESADTGESTLSTDINEDKLNHQQEVLLLGQAHRNKWLRTTQVPLPKIGSRANTVIACPPLPNSWKPPGSMAPPQLKCQKSALPNKSPESDHAPSALALPRSKSSGDQDAPQPKASSDQNVPQHQKATFEVVKRFMEAIVFTKTTQPRLSDDKYSMVEEVRKLAITAHNH